MRLSRVIAERDLRAVGRAAIRHWNGFWRGWDERDVVSLSRRLYDPAAFSGGILKITKREYRALAVYNRRFIASRKGALLYPFLAWVEGNGLRPLRRAA
jgi:hypothetical protein